MSLCSIDGCGKPACNGRGWCGMHYARVIRHGDVSRGRAPNAGRVSAERLCEETASPPGARFIPLTKGKIALVDEADYERIAAFKWAAQTTPKGNVYASRHEPNRGKLILMHREVLAVDDEIGVDHRNRDGLDNRKENLRPATQERNCLNHPGHKLRASRFKGLYWHKPNHRWVASFRGKHLGCFVAEEDAAIAYDRAARAADPEFAFLNFPERESCQAS